MGWPWFLASLASRGPDPPRELARPRWSYGAAPLPLPHCRDVEIIHVPKTAGVALLAALRASSSADLCYSETWIDDVRPCAQLAAGRLCCRQRDGRWRVAAAPCDMSHGVSAGAASRGRVSVGVHERLFGSTPGRAETLYPRRVGFNASLDTRRGAHFHVHAAFPSTDRFSGTSP